MKIQNYSTDFAEQIAELFYTSVHNIDNSMYNQAQRQVWAPEPIDYIAWTKRLEKKQPFIALINERLAGFIELDPDGHIDCCYTHPEYQHRGVATALYAHLETVAKSRGMNHLYVEASHVAKPFFEKHGFALIKENQIERNGVILCNFTMGKWISEHK